MVTSTIHALKQLKTVYERPKSIFGRVQDQNSICDDYFKKSIKDPYLDNIIKNIDDKSVMASFDVYNPARLPYLPDDPCSEDLETFMEYGNDDVDNLPPVAYPGGGLRVLEHPP